MAASSVLSCWQRGGRAAIAQIARQIDYLRFMPPRTPEEREQVVDVVAGRSGTRLHLGDRSRSSACSWSI